MSNAGLRERRGSQRGESIFECDNCNARQGTREIMYDRLGYPVCPACRHVHRP